MENKQIKRHVATLICGLLLSNSIFANQAVEPTEPTKQVVTPEQNAEDGAAASAENTEATVTEQVAPKSSIVEVTPYEMFITDQLFVFIHSGSSNRYRITARVPASEKVTIISKDESTGWLEIKLSDNKTGWIDSTMLANTAGVKSELAKANAKIKDLNVQISKLGKVSTDDLTVLEDEIAKLTKNNALLSEQLLTVTNENQTLLSSIKDIDETKRILAKLYDVGGIVIGVFVGWLLTRRRKEKW